MVLPFRKAALRSLKGFLLALCVGVGILNGGFERSLVFRFLLVPFMYFGSELDYNAQRLGSKCRDLRTEDAEFAGQKGSRVFLFGAIR